MNAKKAKRLKELEDETKRLKELAAELTVDNRMLKPVAKKAAGPFLMPLATGSWRVCRRWRNCRNGRGCRCRSEGLTGACTLRDRGYVSN